MQIDTLHQLFLNSKGVSTDSRKIIKDTIFFSLSGANFNGNAFASNALKEGACYAVIDQKEYYEENSRYILVGNVLQTLQELATFHRNYLKLPIIALTGSNGKTTTKELIRSVLMQKYKVAATLGNLNNHIGVPLTLLSFNKNTNIGVVEMGANHQNEIAKLCEIAQPDYGYITNFGKAHLEGFGGVEGVIKGKSELYQYLEKNNKLAFVNTDDAIQVEKSSKIKSFTFGQQTPTAHLDYETVSTFPYVTLKAHNTIFASQLIGAYNVSNIAIAITMGLYFEVSISQIKQGIENYLPTNNRSQKIKVNSNEVVLDAYNANPSSMKAALDYFSLIPSPNKVAILGDMFELGDASEQEHQAIVNYAESLNIDQLVFVGQHFYKTNTQAQKFKDFEALSKHLSIISFENATLLIKGSRGMALERVLKLL